MGIKSSVANDRPWRIVAGQISHSALHCATVGAAEAVEAINRTNARHWREYNAKAEQRCSIKRHDPPVNIVGGYRFPDAPVIELSPEKSAPATSADHGNCAAELIASIPDERHALSFPGELQKLTCRQSSILTDRHAVFATAEQPQPVVILFFRRAL
jgi:hypothetical protein